MPLPPRGTPCSRCKRTDRLVGPWTDAPYANQNLCGPCKFAEAFSDPKRKARFEREVAAGCRAILEADPKAKA